MHSQHHLLALLASSSSIISTALATTLYISDYSNTLTTASLTSTTNGYALHTLNTTTSCGPNPSWLTLDAGRGLLYCINEELSGDNASLTTYTINPNAGLTHVQSITTPPGPVHGAIYGPRANDHHAIALAHYGGPGLSTWRAYDNGSLAALQYLPFAFAPGHVSADPDRQDTPHPHEVVIDPTGQYALVPDLGADLLRVFYVNVTTLLLEERPALNVTPGMGPRHAAFWNPDSTVCEEGCPTYVYVTGELDQMVHGYQVTYRPHGAGLDLEQILAVNTYGAGHASKRINAPAEILVTPDNTQLLISNRNNTSFRYTFPSDSTTTTTTIPSDSLSLFALSPFNGSLTFLQLAPSAGLYPRQVSLNPDGRLLAVGLQYGSDMDAGNGAVALLPRDPLSGKLRTTEVARLELRGQVTGVWWL